MLGYESQAVNDQLINVAPGQAYAPLTFGAAYVGPGYWPRGGVYNAPPVVPAPGEWGGSAVGDTIQGGAMVGVGGSPTAGALSANGGVNWMHPTKSPLVMAIIFLVLGLFLLHYVHYHEG